MTDSNFPKGHGNLFLSSNGDLRPADLEKITLSLLTYGDCVWLPAAFEISPLTPLETSVSIKKKINGLIESKLVRLWKLEGSDRDESRKADLVIPIEEQRELTGNIDTVALPAASTIITTRPSTQIDTASRLIELRHELWHLGLAAQCEAPGILLGASQGRLGSTPNASRFETLRERLAVEMFDAFRIPSVSNFSTADILDLRKHITGFRDRIDRILAKKPTDSKDDDAISRECKDEFKIYLRMVEDILKSRADIRGADNIYDSASLALEVAGHAIPLAGLLPLSRKFYLWLTNRHNYRFTFYMHKVRRIAEERIDIAR